MKETEQTLLEKIKDQVAREVSVYSAMNAKEFIELELSYAAQHEFINLVCERYATAKAQASCEKSESAYKEVESSEPQEKLQTVLKNTTCDQCRGVGKIFFRANAKTPWADCPLCDGTGKAEVNAHWFVQASYIKKWKEEQQIGLRELARRFSIDPSNLHKMLEGVIRPDAELVKAATEKPVSAPSESQEEMWQETQKVIGRDSYHKFDLNILLKKFTITRNP